MLNLDSSKTVCFATHDVHRHGGMERVTCEVLECMSSMDWDVTAVARSCEAVGVKHTPIKVPRRPAVLAAIAFERRAQRLLSRLNGVVTASTGAAAGPVDVATAHFCHAAFNDRIGLVRASGPISRRLQGFAQARFAADEQRVYGHARLKRVIAVSNGVADEVAEYYGVDSSQISVIPNGSDTSRFRPASVDEKLKLRQRFELPLDTMLSCFVGGDWHRKGLAHAIEALRFATDTGLVVVGAGNQEHYHALAADFGVADRVWFKGSTRHPEDLLRACDTYVFPSSYEAFSLSCIEAAACGLPLIVTPINGMVELVEHGVNGVFIEPCGESIGATLVKLRDDAALRESMSKAIAAKGAALDWDNVAKAHEAVYTEVAKEM